MSIQPTRPFVVYLTDNLIAMGDRATDTAVTIWDGVRHAASDAQIDLLAVVGGGMRESFGSIIYDLIKPATANGFICWISKGEGRTDEYFERFTDSALVALSIPYGQHPVVQIRGEDGLRELMQHLLQVHGYRKLGFIGGQQNHPYAIERRRVFLACLQEAGLTPDPLLMTDDVPTWAWQNGEAAIHCLLDERGLKPGIDLQVLVCASDRLAMGALAELDRRGIRVPQDIALTGFNNLLEAQSHTPSVTTVGSPFSQQGRVAMTYLLALLQGEQPLAPEPLATVMVRGESCGCVHDDQPKVLQPLQAHCTDGPLRQKISESLQAMRSPPVAIEDASARLLAQFKVSVATGEPAFLDLLKSLINARHTAFIDQSHWHDVLSTLRQGWIAGLAAESQRIAEAWLEQARLLLVSYYAREQTQLRQSEIRLAGTVRDIGTRLGKATTTAECMDILSEFMPSLGIDSCWVSVFDSAAGGSQIPEHARLLLDYENRIRNPLPENGLLFRAQDLVPGGLRRGAHPRTLVMHPLAQGADEFGFVIFVQGPEDGGVYDALANLIGNTLKSVWLRMALANRSLELESSLAELRQAQDHLIQREKMAALGELVAGIAHEINTPIGIGVTSISTVSEAGQSLIDALDRRSARDVRSAALDMIDGAEIVQRNLERAGALIESFKLIAVDQSSETHRTFVLASYLSDIVRSLEPRLRPGMHTVTLDCQDGLVLTGDPGVFARVISNLILNSVVHGFENVLNGRILIQCKLDNERVLIDYYDNGCGMADEIRERIFHPFFTTKRGRGGTGLGMHIVFNSVTQGLGGTIQCDSLPGSGTHFTMSLPQQGMD